MVCCLHGLRLRTESSVGFLESEQATGSGRRAGLEGKGCWGPAGISICRVSPSRSDFCASTAFSVLQSKSQPYPS